MSTKMIITARQDMRLTMSPQLRQAISLLQHNTIDLKQLLQQYIEKNPFIDVEEASANEDAKTVETHQDEENHYHEYSTPSNKFHASHTYSGQDNDDKNYIENYSIPQNLRSYLLEQTLLCQFDPVEQMIAEAIIDAIDENGLLTMSMQDIEHNLLEQGCPAITNTHKVLSIIQSMDPPGIAHRDLRECLLIQLNLLTDKSASWEIAHRIINHYFEHLAQNNVKKLLSQLKITKQQFDDALIHIRSLNPKPGLKYNSDIDITIEPELFVKKIKNEWRVFLVDNILNSIKINTDYQNLIKKNKKHSSYEVLNKELQEAKWLITGLKRRSETLFKVASYIMEHQKDFLDHGHAFMKPMNIIDVSQALDIHESTVSRVTTGKYIATPKGMLELKYFFPSYVLTESGEACSATSVKEYIKDIILQETKERILSDGEIALLLKKKGINIARRTVAKYREAMKILPSYQRAQLTKFD
jgi:RNA polymerase sigma-54 factor